MNHRKNEPQPAVRKKGEAGYIRLYKKLREEILSGIEKRAERAFVPALQAVYDTLFSECVKLEQLK